MNYSILYPFMSIIGTILFLLICYSDYRRSKSLPADVVKKSRINITIWLISVGSISFIGFYIFRDVLNIEFINGMKILLFIITVVLFIRELILNRISSSFFHK